MTERNDHDVLMTKQEFATELRVSTRTVERMVAAGEISAQKVGRAGLIRIPRTELTKVLSPTAPVDSSANEPAGASSISGDAA